MQKYSLEFILHAYNTTEKALRNALTEFSEGLQIEAISIEGSESWDNFKISARTEDPTIIFDICSQFGRIKEIKIDEGG